MPLERSTIIREATLRAEELKAYVHSVMDLHPQMFNHRGVLLFDNYINTAMQYLKSPMTFRPDPPKEKIDA